MPWHGIPSLEVKKILVLNTWARTKHIYSPFAEQWIDMILPGWISRKRSTKMDEIICEGNVHEEMTTVVVSENDFAD